MRPTECVDTECVDTECVDLFGWHLNCTNACLVRWVKQYEASQR